jgi:hypothetical protein
MLALSTPSTTGRFDGGRWPPPISRYSVTRLQFASEGDSSQDVRGVTLELA